ncbi:hypothetical protein DWX81_17660, partial [Roseburia inulinivorans]
KNGYNKSKFYILFASPRNDADFLISAREIVIDKEMNKKTDITKVNFTFCLLLQEMMRIF